MHHAFVRGRIEYGQSVLAKNSMLWPNLAWLWPNFRPYGQSLSLKGRTPRGEECNQAGLLKCWTVGTSRHPALAWPCAVAVTTQYYAPSEYKMIQPCGSLHGALASTLLMDRSSLTGGCGELNTNAEPRSKHGGDWNSLSERRLLNTWGRD